MTEREEYELVAKACGMPLGYVDGWRWAENVGPSKLSGLWKGVAYPTLSNPNPRYTPVRWNPKHDDGDAFRLAVRLDLHSEYMRFINLCMEDKYAATRLAIWRAAVEYSKSLEK